MTYKRDMIEVFGFIVYAFYGLFIVGMVILGGIIILLLSYFNLCCETYWYIGIPMIVGGIFLVPTIGRVCDITMNWHRGIK